MVRDLDLGDVEKEEPVDVDFLKSIEGITSQTILDKLSYPTPLHTYIFDRKIQNDQVNTARFMMEGMGFPSKYWLCTGVDTLGYIMYHHMENSNYNELVKISGRKDVLCLLGLPLFFVNEPSLGDCLLLVSDISQSQVRVCCFNNCQTKMKPPLPVAPAMPKYSKKNPAYIDLDGDEGLDDYDDDDDYDDVPF